MNLTAGPETVAAALVLAAVGFAAGWLARARRPPGRVAAAPPEPAAQPEPLVRPPAAAPPSGAGAAPPPPVATPIDVGALVAGVAHEVRNPLFSISATLDAFEARFGTLPEYRPYTTVLRGELTRITSLVEKLVEYGRPGAPVFAEGRLEPALELALDLVEPIVRHAGVTIHQERAEAADQPTPLLRLDRERLARALRQMIENAAQFTPAGGRVVVRVRTDEPGRLVVDVLDDGPGLTEEEARQAVEPFFTRRRGGAGLGLAIARRIAEEHDGTLSVRSRPEGGACQSLRLPVRDAAAPLSGLPAAAVAVTGGVSLDRSPGAASGEPRSRMNDGS